MAPLTHSTPTTEWCPQYIGYKHCKQFALCFQTLPFRPRGEMCLHVHTGRAADFVTHLSLHEYNNNFTANLYSLCDDSCGLSLKGGCVELTWFMQQIGLDLSTWMGNRNKLYFLEGKVVFVSLSQDLKLVCLQCLLHVFDYFSSSQSGHVKISTSHPWVVVQPTVVLMYPLLSTAGSQHYM